MHDQTDRWWVSLLNHYILLIITLQENDGHKWMVRWGVLEWLKITVEPQNNEPLNTKTEAFHLRFDLNYILITSSSLGLETRIFENGTASFGWTRPTGQRAPPLEVDHFFRKISTWTEAFHLCFDQNHDFWKFWHNRKYPRWSQCWSLSSRTNYFISLWSFQYCYNSSKIKWQH